VTSGNLQEADKIRLRREAKKNRGFYVEDEAQLVFVIRIRGINDMAPKVSTLHQCMRTS
jgi:large subunit ribosomal protein L7e